MSHDFDGFLTRCKQQCEASLTQLLGPAQSEFAATQRSLATLFAASQYSLLNGGKRVRPALVYAAAEAIDAGANLPALDHAACAVEMIHVYSLIHDDLPAMDDDDLRRGKPSCHKAYDEALAILAGDGLQARAFELLATAPGSTPERQLAMISTLAAASGPRGMVGGQAIDIAATEQSVELAQLKTMHSLKTGALIRAALSLGGTSAGGSQGQLDALDDYGAHIGLAFQVVDDILDVTSDTATLGKTQGKDGAANKPTYVSFLGLDGAKSEAQNLLQCAHGALDSFGPSADHLRSLAHYVVARSH